MLPHRARNHPHLKVECRLPHDKSPLHQILTHLDTRLLRLPSHSLLKQQHHRPVLADPDHHRVLHKAPPEAVLQLAPQGLIRDQAPPNHNRQRLQRLNIVSFCFTILPIITDFLSLW